jgi:HEPN domain-containing protein
VLYKGGEYSNCLFFGHIVIEKILKALVVQETRKHPPRIHDLVRLSKLARLDLEEDKIELLDTINEFNIRARYPDYKEDFYQKCTKSYTKKYYQEITKLYKELCKLINPY